MKLIELVDAKDSIHKLLDFFGGSDDFMRLMDNFHNFMNEKIKEYTPEELNDPTFPERADAPEDMVQAFRPPYEAYTAYCKGVYGHILEPQDVSSLSRRSMSKKMSEMSILEKILSIEYRLRFLGVQETGKIMMFYDQAYDEFMKGEQRIIGTITGSKIGNQYEGKREDVISALLREQATIGVGTDSGPIGAYLEKNGKFEYRKLHSFDMPGDTVKYNSGGRSYWVF